MDIPVSIDRMMSWKVTPQLRFDVIWDPQKTHLLTAVYLSKYNWKTREQKSNTSWWFQPLWKILVKMDHLHKSG